VVNKIGEIMNYSLTGKARVAAKNTIKQEKSRKDCAEKFLKIQEKKIKREAHYIRFDFDIFA
jgi:hypothetical protein